MTNAAVIVIYLPICLITVMVLVLAGTARRKDVIVQDLIALLLLTLFWQLCSIGYFATNHAFAARYFYDLKLAAVAFCAPVLLRFTVHFYRMDRLLTRPVNICLFIIPSITALLAATSPLHRLLRSQLVIDTSGVLHQELNIRGIWFWAHTAYSYALILISLLVALIRWRKQSNGNRLSSGFLLFGIAIAGFCNLLLISGQVSLPFDITLIGMSIAEVFLYISMVTGVSNTFLLLARGEIFNYLEEYLFILDNDRVIIEMNRAARQWMRELNMTLRPRVFEDILSYLKKEGADFRDSVGNGGMDIYLNGLQRQTIYNLRENPILDDNGVQQGAFVTCMDVTQNRMLIERLEQTAGIDALTGLMNRRSMEQVKPEIDVPGSLPLVVLMGDLNGLKYVNDTFGHKQGDVLLRLTASLLEEACPERGKLFRIGGDEFVLYIPNCTREQAESVIDDINRRFAAVDGYPFQPSISLGYAVKERPEEDIDTIFEIADKSMYSRKRFERQRRVD